MEPVVLQPGAEENGLAAMLADLLRQNLEAHPGKHRDLEALRARVGIVAEDAGVAITLVFDHGGARVHDGLAGVPDVTIRAGTETILKLTLVRIGPFGLPLPSREDAMGLARAIARGELRIQGAWNVATLLRLTRLLSIHGRRNA